ncbi:HD domain-containing protein [Butyrivibrio sp. AE2032]|uniref:HD domain-containing protein n=1 Tax=Butyrivibrio sp. AE2032 TaxID=1458463 RepID=UPI000690EC12|nr:HD domain-containing protein [Butyrivibrio sp. AE2032]
MAIIKFNTMTFGTHETVAVVAGVTQAATANNKPMMKVTLNDGTDNVTALIFDTTKKDLTAGGITEGTTVAATLEVTEYKGNKSYKITNITPVKLSEDELRELIKLPPIEPAKLVNDTIMLIKKSSGREYDMTVLEVPADDFSLTALAVRLILGNIKAFTKSSAAKSMHHDLYGGLAYHTYRMVKTAFAVCDIYTLLNRELLVCGTALHDIGKLVEMKTSDTGIATYTDMGNLFGHPLLGIEMIDHEVWRQDQAIGGKSYNREQVAMVKHMIASHHGQQEWGAIRVPSTPEAMMLHEIDMIDSRMYMYEDAFGSMMPGSSSDPIFGIAGDGKSVIYKNSFSDYT